MIPALANTNPSHDHAGKLVQTGEALMRLRAL